MKSKASNEFGSEDNQEHFNFETLKIGGNYVNPARCGVMMQKCQKQAKNKLYKISHLTNPAKNQEIYHTPIILGSVNIRLGKAKFCTLRIVLESSTSS